MREKFYSEVVKELLSDTVSSIEVLTKMLSKLSSEHVFSTQDALAIIKKCNSLKLEDDSEQYDLAIGSLLERCSYDACKFIAPQIKGGIRKHLHIILANKEIAEKLFCTNLYSILEILKEPISDADIQAILPVFMQSACKYTNMEQLKFIHTNYPQYFAEIAKSPAFIEYGLLLSAAVDSDFDPKLDRAREYSQFGGIDFDGMLTLCAALHESKPYFNPVVLNCEDDSNEMKELLQFIFDNRAFFNNREPVVFIVKAYHTISGSIQIIDGVVHLTFIDSLGKEKLMSDMQWYDTMRPQDLINFAKQLFGDDSVKDNVLIPEQRQMSGLGCTMFATKDAMVISKDPSILLEPPESPRLWTLLKTAQTSRVPDRLKAEQSKEFVTAPINKKGGTYLGFFFKYFREDPVRNKKTNYYMHDKLGKWRDKVVKFLRENSEEELIDKTSQFSLDGFRKALEKEICQDDSRNRLGV